MVRLIRSAVLVFVALVSACRTTPTLNGEPLQCEGSCPGELRCIDAICVQNSPPVMLPLAARQAVVGIPITIDPGDPINDNDGDPYDFVWTQIQGPVAAITGAVSIGPPEALAETTTDGPLTVTFDVVGLYVFEVRGDDGFDVGSPQKLAVTATNTPPAIETVLDLYVLQNDPVNVTVVAADADGHSIALSWQQLGGPSITLPASGGSLSFVATDLGLYWFEVTAFDGFGSSEPMPVRVIAQPQLDSVYVSDTGATGDPGGCGSIDSPCGTVAEGLAVMRALPAVQTVLVAASDRPYTTCLDLDAGERLFGAFEPLFWQRNADLRIATRIDCDDPNGHEINDTNAEGTELVDVLLSSSAPDSLPLVTTVTIRNGNPTVRAVDVETASCGSGCSVVGIASLGASPLIEDVDIRAAASDFVRVDTFVGLRTLGGQPTMVSTAMSRSADDGMRGTITLDAAADTAAFGVIAGGSILGLDRIVIRGGLAPLLGGVWGLDADIALSGVVIEMTSFGTSFMEGVTVSPCAPGDSRCDCSGVNGGCLVTEPSVSIDGGSVELRGSLRFDGFVPCRAVGLDAVEAAAVQVSGGAEIRLVGSFHFGIGVLLQPTSSGVASVTGSTIEIDDGRLSQVCDALVQPIVSQPFGNVGLFVTSGVGAQLLDNSVTVGTHDGLSIGLRFASGADAVIQDNRIRVERTGPNIAGIGIGVSLETSTSTGANSYGLFARNRVRVGAGVIEGSAAVLWSDSPWVVRNNFFSGGDALYASGMRLDNLGKDWPKIYHNTVVGSESSASLTSRAVLVLGAVQDPLDPVEVFGNLLDAGEARGQRLIIDNWAGVALPGNASNVGQIVPPAIQDAVPTFLFASALPGDGNVTSLPIGPARISIHVLMEGRGEIAPLNLFGPPTNNPTVPVLTRGVPVPRAAWSGISKGIDTLVVVLEPDPVGPGLIGVSDLRGRQVLPMTRHIVRSTDGAVRRPRRAVVSRVNENQPADLFFIENEGEPATDGLWVMRAAKGRGFLPAELVSTLADPTFLDLLLDASVLVLATGVSGKPAIFGFRPDSLELAVGFPADVDTYMPSVPTLVGDIDHIVSTSFAEESGNAGPYGDSVVLFNDEIHAVLSWSSSGVGEAAGLAGVCAGLGVPEAFAIGPVADGPGGETTPYELVVACNDTQAGPPSGILKICKLVTPFVTPTFICGDDIVTDGPITAIAIERRSLGTTAYGSDVIVSHRDGMADRKLEGFEIDPTNTALVTGPVFGPLYPNVTARDETAGFAPVESWPLAWPTFLTEYGVSDSGHCEMEFRTGTPQLDPPHLGLTAAATSCIDQVPWSASDPFWQIPDDIDGDVRPNFSGGLFDIGADER